MKLTKEIIEKYNLSKRTVTLMKRFIRRHSDLLKALE